VKKELKGGLCC